MDQNLQAWMDNYAERFLGPDAVTNTPMQQNLAAPAQPPAGQPAAPGQLQTFPVTGGNEPTQDNSGQSFEAMFKAQPVEHQDQQIDELEKSVGDINQVYGQLQKQLGQRPSTKLSRREKGMMIMEFGLQLLSASSKTGNFGEALGEAGTSTMGTYRNLAASKDAKARQWDQDNTALQIGRIKDVGAARKEATAERRQRNQDQVAQDRADETARHNQAMETNANSRLTNLENWQQTQVEKGVGAGRKPASSSTGGLTANQRNIDDLKKRGVPEDMAVKLVYRQIKDPKKAWQDLYNSLRGHYTNTDDAQAEADRIIGLLYGDGAIDKSNKPVVPPEKKIVRRGKDKKTGRPVVQYDDGSMGYAD